jgi:protein TonB
MATRTSTPPSPDPTKTNNAIAASTTQPPPVLNNTGYTIGDKNTEGVPRSIGIIGPPGPTDNDNKKFSDDTPPPPRRDDSRNTEQKRSIVVSKGVVTGMATALPQPIYPRIALQSGVFGTVTVQVLIDEDGKVISAKAVSGHPLLLSAAVTAAYRARFTPTRLSEVPVKVSGVINYNFQKQ